MKQTLILSVLLLLLAACSKTPSGVDLAMRARIDGYNKTSFLSRYKDPSSSIHEAYAALNLCNDSLPNYHDGQLRAFNNLAFGYYMLAQTDSSKHYIDTILLLTSNSQVRHTATNAEVERLIAQLMRIRLLQRSCSIAESYQLLYDIHRSKVLSHKPDNYLYSYAQMEYFITSLTLNYHYRNSAVASSSSTLLDPSTQQNMRDLLTDVEEARHHLRCDYAEDLSLNYAIAHSYYRLASTSRSNPHLLGKAYDYLSENLRILQIPGQYSIYHLANVFQLQAFIVADTNITPATYERHCRSKVEKLHALSASLYPADSLPCLGDYGLDMFRISTQLFFQTPDPYQHLGAVVAAAEYSLRQGAYDEAFRYYDLILSDTTWHDGMAPKFESMLYDGLIRSHYSPSVSDNLYWYDCEMQLLTFIRQNESADVMLQDRLDQSESRNHYYILAIFSIIPFAIVLLVLVLLLRKRSHRLRLETLALQQAKKLDVERIANVETCLSVMRHDVNPFLSYLQNKKLTPEMRQEVLDQLLRTFSNIKRWTNLSIPSGLQFQPTQFRLSTVFGHVADTCINVHHQVDLVFQPTAATVWGDSQLTEILLRNLVNNALQHTAQGFVRVSASSDGDAHQFVHIVVQDSGCGMSPETIEDLFRADKKINSDGENSHGFGLILCKYIIKRHDDNTLRGCRIWAESQEGQGTAMHVLLAAAPSND